MAKGECSCYYEYPNPCHRRRNGNWLCVDKYECIRPLQRKENGRVKLKTVCRKKEVVDDGETAERTKDSRH